MADNIKANLRSELKTKRQALMRANSCQIEKLIFSQLRRFFENNPFFQKKIIGIYYPIIGEINLFSFYKYLAENGYRLALTSFTTNSNKLEFYEINVQWELANPFYDFPKVQFGNTEIVIAPRNLPICTPELILIPALGFNKLGFRLGYGKGYYDNYLQLHPKCLSVGIVQDELEIFAEFAQEFDVKLKTIITPKRIINL